MIHGFREDRGVGNASLEVNLIHQLTVIMEDFLYKVYFISENPMTPSTGSVA